uniref:Uncharacterized protein n=1 Tax=Trichuris muris TaxID=70415 RepID=A0A5S6R2L4_TRIMR
MRKRVSKLLSANVIIFCCVLKSWRPCNNRFRPKLLIASPILATRFFRKNRLHISNEDLAACMDIVCAFQGINSTRKAANFDQHLLAVQKEPRGGRKFRSKKNAKMAVGFCYDQVLLVICRLAWRVQKLDEATGAVSVHTCVNAVPKLVLVEGWLATEGEQVKTEVCQVGRALAWKRCRRTSDGGRPQEATLIKAEQLRAAARRRHIGRQGARWVPGRFPARLRQWPAALTSLELSIAKATVSTLARGLLHISQPPLAPKGSAISSVQPGGVDGNRFSEAMISSRRQSMRTVVPCQGRGTVVRPGPTSATGGPTAEPTRFELPKNKLAISMLCAGGGRFRAPVVRDYMFEIS